MPRAYLVSMNGTVDCYQVFHTIPPLDHIALDLDAACTGDQAPWQSAWLLPALPPDARLG
jgi:hypothetical protein